MHPAHVLEKLGDVFADLPTPEELAYTMDVLGEPLHMERLYVGDTYKGQAPVVEIKRRRLPKPIRIPDAPDDAWFAAQRVNLRRSYLDYLVLNWRALAPRQKQVMLRVVKQRVEAVISDCHGFLAWKSEEGFCLGD